MTIIHFQCSKGVIVLDSSGELFLSIPANATCHSYDNGNEKVVSHNQPHSFPYPSSCGILSYKQGSSLYSLVVTATEHPEVKAEKTRRFTLEANSVVPSSMSVGKYINITDISLNLSAAVGKQASHSDDPVHLLQQLASGAGSNVPQPSAKDKGCCDVQVSTYDPVKNITKQQQISVSNRSNPELEQRIKEATDRMLRPPPRQMQQQVKYRTPPSIPTPSIDKVLSNADDMLASYSQEAITPAAVPPVSGNLAQTLQSLQALTQSLPVTPGMANPMAALQQALAGAPSQQTPPPVPQQQPQMQLPQFQQQPQAPIQQPQQFQQQQQPPVQQQPQQMHQQQYQQPQMQYQQQYQQQPMQFQPPPRNFADRFSAASQLASQPPPHAQQLVRAQQQQQFQQMQSQHSQHSQHSQQRAPQVSQSFQQSSVNANTNVKDMAGQMVASSLLAGFASMPGMANAMNAAMASGESPSTDDLMRLADDIIRKGKS